jgi:transposase
VQSLSTIIATFNSQIAALEKQVTACFGRTRDAEIYLSQPGLGQILAAARILGEVGDDPERYASEPSTTSTPLGNIT